MPRFKLHPKLVWETSTLKDGNLSFLYGNSEEVIKSRRDFLQRIKLKENQCACMQVEHSSTILEINIDLLGMSLNQSQPKADVLMTKNPRTGLFLLSADCIPLVFYSPDFGLLGLAHLGWKNLVNGTLDRLSSYLLSRYSLSFASLYFGIGPCIRQSSYLRNSPVQLNQPEWQDHLKKVGSDLYSIDLVGFAIKQIVKLGGKFETIKDSGIDTATHPDYFSHTSATRNHQVEGRFATLVYFKTS